MSVANTYAKALYEAAYEKANGGDKTAFLDQVEKQFDELLATVGQSRELETALYAPIANAHEKAGLVRELGKKMGMNELFVNFLTILANKGRLPLLKQIRAALSSVRLRAEGGVAGRLVAAETMADADVQGLAQAFSRKLGRKVAFQVSVDPSLLAGMKVTVNGVTYDGTLRAQLERLRDRIVLGAPGA